MPRPSNSTSAYESFPAQEFDAWIDHLRHTIIDGLEEPELDLPKLSNGALEAVKQAEREAAEAEARAQEVAQAREEEARQAAQRQLEEQRRMLAQLQQKKQQLEEQRQQLEREQERRDIEQQQYEEEQQRHEEERRLQESHNGVIEQGEDLDEDAEYEQDSGEIGGADHEEQGFADDGGSEDHQGRPSDYDEPTADHEDDLFGDEEDPFDDEQPQFPESPRPQGVYAHQQEVSEEGDDEEIIEEDEEEMQTMEVDESGRTGSQSEEEEGSLRQSEGDRQDRSSEQSEGEEVARSASDEDVRSASEKETAFPQGYRRMYATVQPNERDASESQEGDYEQGEEYGEQGEEYDEEDQDPTRPLEDEESEREDAVWEDDEQPRSRQPAQPASYPSPPNQSREEDQDQVYSESETGQVAYEESEGDEAGSQEEQQPSPRQPLQLASYLSPPTHGGNASVAIEFIDSSDGENESAQTRQSESASQESGEERDDRPRRDLRGELSGDVGASDAEAAPERSVDSREEENSEVEYADENEEPPRFTATSTQRPSDYDMEDDRSENGYESDEEGADDESDVQDQADATELEHDAIVMRGSSEDELAEDEEDQQATVETEYAVNSGVERPRRTVEPSSEGDVALDIDPALHYEYTEVEQAQQMVQVSSQSVVASGLLQLAYGTGSRIAAVAQVTTPGAALGRADSEDRQIHPEANEAALPRHDGSPLQEPESDDFEDRRAENVSGAVELEPSATQAAAVVDDAYPETETTSAPGIPRSAIPSGRPAILSTSTYTEYEADDELHEEEGLSAAPSISTFSAIFANTPTRLSPARESHADYVAENEEEGHPVDANAVDTSRLEEEPRTQDTVDIDASPRVDVGSGAESDEELESVGEAANHTSTADAPNATATFDASYNDSEDGTQHPAADFASSPGMPLTQETRREIASDDGRGNLEEQVSDDSAPAKDADNGDSVLMDAVGQPKEQDSGSPELEEDNDTETASPPTSVGDVEAMEVDLPQPEEIPSRHETTTGPPEQKGHFASDFDRSANFVPLKTPPDDQDDELEDGEIRDDDEAVFEERQESSSSETKEDVGRSTGIVGMQDDEHSQNAEPIELEIEVDIDIEVDVDAEDQEAYEGAEEQGSSTGSDVNEEEPETLSGSENADGIQRGTAEVMGSRLEGVRADELATLEEDDDDSQINPDYSSDDRPSAEDIQYDSEDPLPQSPTPAPEVTEADPDDHTALPREIRRHNRRDIPHKDEHLVEEDEEFDNDTPEHHIDGIPEGYEGYPIVDETNPEDVEIFNVAEREARRIEVDRTTEQIVIEEMALRQQPGDPLRASHGSSLPGSSASERDRPGETVQPSASNDSTADQAVVEDSPADIAKDEDVPRVEMAPSLPIDGTVTQDGEVNTAEPTEASTNPTEVPEIGTVPSVEYLDGGEHPLEGRDAEDVDIFDTQLSPEVEHSHEHAGPISIVDLLSSDKLPPAPPHDRSSSPLAPERELQHDITLAMEPAPLLHRHDHHHNVVVEESHRLHEEKRESFTSALAAVHETPASPVGQASTSQQEPQPANDGIQVDDGKNHDATLESEATFDIAPNLPTHPPLGTEQVEQEAANAHQDDDEDPLRLSGPFSEEDSGPSPPMSGVEVYVELPILDRNHAWHSDPSDVQIEVEQRSTRPSTPVHPSTLSALPADPTRHHHGPIHSASFSSIRSGDLEVSGSPAAHTRSQCHYHKIRFGRGVFSHVLLIPHCSIGTEEVRQQMGATDLGRVTKEEMLRKRDLDLGETFTNKMTSDVETLPDTLEHQVKQLAGTDLLREGHIWLLPLADIAPQSMVNRTLQQSEDLQEDDVFHVRSSPRISNRAPSQTPDRKRKRASSRARSTSATRSEVGGSPESATMGTRSRSRAAIVRKVSQIDEKDEDAQAPKEEAQTEGDDQPMGDSLAAVTPKEEDGNSIEDGEIEDKAVRNGEESPVASPEVVSDPSRLEKRANADVENDEDDVADERASKKRIIEGEDGEGPNAVDVRPAQKTGWLAWIFGKR